MGHTSERAPDARLRLLRHRHTKPLVSTLTMSASERAISVRSVTYSGCRVVRRLGKMPLYAGQPGYREPIDGDGDGIACEDY